MLLLAALLQAQPPLLEVTRIARVTDAPGMRDHAAAVSGPRGTVVFWEQSPGIDGTGAVLPPVHIWRAVVGRVSAEKPERVTTQGQNQWWPALLTDPQGAWLAYYSADSRRRTGDRDIVLQALDPSFRAIRAPRSISVDPPRAPLPLNDATPALVRMDDGRILLVWSRGAYDARAKGYADKDLMQRVMRADGSLEPEGALTGADEKGREMAPALAVLPGGRMLLAYVSDSAHEGRPVLYARTLDTRLRPGPPRRLSDPKRGVTRPSLARLGSALWISWYDLKSNDIQIARVLSESTLSAPTSLRELLSRSDFKKYGVPRAGLSGASLFVDQDRLGVAFVATMVFDRATRRSQQDVFLAWISVH